MKPVLVIDNREEYAPAGDHEDLVECRKDADVTALDPALYAAVFVHDDNDAELNWARQNAASHFNGYYFKFTGRKGQFDHVTFHRGAYKLPRYVFKDRFQEFLRRYRERGIVDEQVARTFTEV